MSCKWRVEVIKWIHNEYKDRIIRTTQSPWFISIKKREVNIEVINQDDRSNHILQIKICKIRLKNIRKEPYTALVMSKEVNGKRYNIVPDSKAEDDGCFRLKLKPYEGNTEKSNRFYLIHRDNEGIAIESVCPSGYFLKADQKSKSLFMVKNTTSSFHPNEKFEFYDPSENHLVNREPKIWNSDHHHDSNGKDFIHSDSESSDGGNQNETDETPETDPTNNTNRPLGVILTFGRLFIKCLT